MATTNSKMELYKARHNRGNGLGSREARSKLKTAQSRNDREAVLMSRRRIPLSEIRDEEPRKNSDKKTESDLRLQKLKEWKAKRDEMREKERAAKKRPFFGGGGGRVVPAQNKYEGVMAAKLQRDTETAKAPAMKQPSTTTTTAATAPSSKVKPPRVPHGVRNGPLKNKPSHPPLSSAQPSVATRASKRLAAQKAQLDKPLLTSAPARGQARQNSTANKKKTALSKNDKTSKAAKDDRCNGPGRVTRRNVASGSAASVMSGKEGVNKATTGKRGKGGVNAGKSLGAPTSGKKRVKAPATPVNTKLNYSDCSSESMATMSCPSPPPSHTPSSPPTTLIHSPPHLPTPPLPPPQSQFQAASGDFVPECAWIANQKISSHSTLNSIDTLLGPCTFSPFKFTAGQTTTSGKKRQETPGETPFVFTFKKALDNSPASLQAEMIRNMERVQSDVVSSDAISVDSLECCPPTPGGEASSVTAAQGVGVSPCAVVSMCSGAEVSCEGVGDGGELGEEAVGDGDCEKRDSGFSKETEQNPAGIDFAYFHGLHDDVISNFTSLCSLWKEKSQYIEAQIEQAQDGEDTSHLNDVVDQIRSTVCQSELLMRQKLKQYIGLVTSAENGTDNHTTSAQDLQGFWDMVSMQVVDVEQKFQNLTELEQNDWRQPQMEQNRDRKKAKKRAKSSSTRPANLSKKQLESRERREAMRMKLKEMKAAAANSKRAGIRETDSTEHQAADSQPSPPATNSSGFSPVLPHTTSVVSDTATDSQVPTSDLLCLKSATLPSLKSPLK